MNITHTTQSSQSLEQALDLLIQQMPEYHPIENLSQDIAATMLLNALRRQANTLEHSQAQDGGVAHDREDAISEVFLSVVTGQTRWGQSEERDAAQFLRGALNDAFKKTQRRGRRAPLWLDAPQHFNGPTLIEPCEAPDTAADMTLQHTGLWDLFQEGLLPIIAEHMGKAGRTTCDTVVEMLHLRNSTVTISDLVLQHHPKASGTERRRLTNRLNKRHQRTRERLLTVIEAALELTCTPRRARIASQNSDATHPPRVQAAAAAFVEAFSPTQETLVHLQLLVMSLRLRAESVT